MHTPLLPLLLLNWVQPQPCPPHPSNGHVRTHTTTQLQPPIHWQANDMVHVRGHTIEWFYEADPTYKNHWSRQVGCSTVQYSSESHDAYHAHMPRLLRLHAARTAQQLHSSVRTFCRLIVPLTPTPNAISPPAVRLRCVPRLPQQAHHADRGTQLGRSEGVGHWGEIEEAWGVQPEADAEAEAEAPSCASAPCLKGLRRTSAYVLFLTAPCPRPPAWHARVHTYLPDRQAGRQVGRRVGRQATCRITLLDASGSPSLPPSPPTHP